MLPIGQLMREHRTIEKMIASLGAKLGSMHEGKMDAVFLREAVDFLHTYADRTHHGKEEDILFRDLAGKSLTPDHRRIMGELIMEHADARRHVAALDESVKSYEGGDTRAISEAVLQIGAIIALYPTHIEKEDRHFFYPAMAYFNADEKETMMREFDNFDRKMIHERYGGRVEVVRYRGDTTLMRCTVCGYIYGKSEGDPEHGVSSGTSWDGLPQGWSCPICHAAKSLFEKFG